MTAFSLYPSFVVINYHSDLAPHKMTLPTRQWNGAFGSFGNGGYTSWDAGEKDADDMVKDLINKIKVVMPDETTFDDYVIYNVPNLGDPPNPVAAGALTITGTGSIDAIPAAMQTWSFRTANFHHFKLVLLDVVCQDEFRPVKTADLSGDQDDIPIQLNLATEAWSGRDGARITTLIQITSKLNDKLRKAYRLT